MLVAGMEVGTPYLGFVDKIGVAYEENAIATGFGAHIALVRDVERKEDKKGGKKRLRCNKKAEKRGEGACDLHFLYYGFFFRWPPFRYSFSR